MLSTGSYFDKALTDTNGDLIANMRHETKAVKYDTIVGTGLSGTIFTARVAPGLGKKFAIVRKKDDHSTHSDNRVEGTAGKRWIFVDDFVSGGGTLKHVLGKMRANFPTSEFGGVYQYECPDFSDPDESAYRWGNWVTELSIGLLYGPKSLAQIKRETPWNTAPLRVPLDGWDARVKSLVPISGRSNLDVDYPDGYGRPTIYDRATRVRWTCEDEKALPYIVEVEKAAEAFGVSIRRMVGERMHRLPKPRTPIRFPFERNAIQNPVDAVMSGE